MRAGRFLAVAAIGLAALAAAALAQVTPRGFLPTEETECYTCHDTWRTPLVSIANILPPRGASNPGATVGQEFDYAVTFQEAWTPRADFPHLQFVAPSLDLSRAPSLRFGGGHDPIPGLHLPVTVPVDPTKANQPQEGNTTVEVPPGASTMTLKVVPADAGQTGPDLTLVIRPPTGTVEPVNQNGPGGTEERSFTLEELQQYGSGNWTVGARFTPVPAPGSIQLPTLTDVRFDVVQDAAFDAAAISVQAFPAQVDIPAGGAFVQTWRLKVLAAPGADEVVRLALNTTAYYAHVQPVRGGDHGDYRVRLDVPVIQAGDRVKPELTVLESVAPRIINGPTLATISEAVGYASAFLLVSSIWSGGMFGKASRRSLNSVFGAAKRRVAFHNFLSYGIILAALVHLVLFLVEEEYAITVGLIWGTLATLGMLGLGLTGALQVPMIRRWSYGTWRGWHYGLTVFTIVLTVAHGLLDGVHFGEVQKALHWTDPFQPSALA